MENTKKTLYEQYFEETISFFSSFSDRLDLFRKNGIEYFTEFTQLLEDYGFTKEPDDHAPFHYILDAEPFFYSVSLFGEKLYFRLSYRSKNGMKIGAEHTNRFYQIFNEFRCLEEVFFCLTNNIARLILKNNNNEEDMLNLVRRRLKMKEPC